MERRSLGSSRKPLFSRPTWNCWNVHGKMEDPNRSGSLNRWGNLNDSNYEKHVSWFKNKVHANTWYIENTPKLYLDSSKITVYRIILLFSKNVVNLIDFLGWDVMNEILCCYWMNSSSIVIEGNNSCLQCYDKKSIWENWGWGFPFVIFIKFLLNQWDEGVFC